MKEVKEQNEAWEWNFGATIEFSVYYEHAAWKLEVQVCQGRVRDVIVSGEMNVVENEILSIVGSKFEAEEISNFFKFICSDANLASQYEETVKGIVVKVE